MSGPRPEKTERTRERIQLAAAELFNENAATELITFKAVAHRARVAEMTVYRYFPTRAELLRGLWEHLDRRLGAEVGVPDCQRTLRAQQIALFRAFDKMPSQIMASIASPSGRGLRAASISKVRAAFLSITDEVAPGLRSAEKNRVAAVLQLLHSAYAWASLCDQWGLSADAAGEATLWAVDTLLADLKKRDSLNLAAARPRGQ